MHYGCIHLFHLDAYLNILKAHLAIAIGVFHQREGKGIVGMLIPIHYNTSHDTVIAGIELGRGGIGNEEEGVILGINAIRAMPGEGALLYRIHTNLFDIYGIPSDGYTVILEREFEMHIALNAFCWYCCHIYISY